MWLLLKRTKELQRVESTEKVFSKHYVMERMTSGLIRRLGKSLVQPRWSTGSLKTMRQWGFGHFSQTPSFYWGEWLGPNNRVFFKATREQRGSTRGSWRNRFHRRLICWLSQWESTPAVHTHPSFDVHHMSPVVLLQKETSRSKIIHAHWHPLSLDSAVQKSKSLIIWLVFSYSISKNFSLRLNT